MNKKRVSLVVGTQKTIVDIADEMQKTDWDGAKSHFMKVTITLPPDWIEKIHNFRFKKKLDGEKHTDTSSILRTVIGDWIETID